MQSGDTVTGIRDALVNLINQDPKVTATPSGEFQRIILQARVQGPEGNGLAYTASASSTATVIMTAIGSSLVLRRRGQLSGDAARIRRCRAN